MDLITFIDKGGIIVYILIFLNILGFSIILLKIFTLFSFKKQKEKLIENIISKIGQSYNKMIIYKFDSIITNEIIKLESGLNTIKTIATISPLLGLLGTVLGIFTSFDIISQVGLDDPLLFSSGISIALITTIVGLIVAIPHYIFYNYYINILDNYEQNLKNEILKTL